MLLTAYIQWHYTRALTEMVSIGKTIVWFLYHFFSISILAKTLFAPFKRLDEKGGRRLQPDVLAVNIIMRVVGFTLRFLVLLLGLLFILLVVTGVVLVYLLWIAMPALLGALCIAPLLLFL
ncbi:MAG: hypothetical protein WDZ88_00350 [Candidatus Paceibacterota bacterium]